MHGIVRGVFSRRNRINLVAPLRLLQPNTRCKDFSKKPQGVLPSRSRRLRVLIGFSKAVLGSTAKFRARGVRELCQDGCRPSLGTSLDKRPFDSIRICLPDSLAGMGSSGRPTVPNQISAVLWGAGDCCAL